MKNVRQATMGDVARAAGVSPATVARVLYEPDRVAGDKRQRVTAALEATGYRPNAVARGLRTQRSHTIGLLIVEGTLNPFFSQLSQAIRIEAMERGYTILLFQHGMKPEREAAAVAHLMQQRADAVIFSYAVTAEGMEPLVRAGIPIVQIEQEVRAGTHVVLIDPVPGIDAAVDHLVGLGHRGIAFIGGDPELYKRARVRGTSMEDDRLAAFRSAMARHDLPVPAHHLALGRYFTLSSDDPAAEGRRMMEGLLNLHPRPTAVLASGDVLAAGALQALTSAGLRVPDDMSVIGFDDSIANILAPPLASIGRPLDEMARQALNMAISATEGGTSGTGYARLPTRLVMRKSTGPVP